MTKRDDLIALICGEIMNSSRLRNIDWKMVTIVFDIGVGSVANSGFAYLEEKVVAVSASGSAVGDYVRVLRDELKLPDKGPFVQMLVQIRRSDGKIRADFEYEDRSRWRISPANLAGMREALRPKFDD